MQDELSRNTMSKEQNICERCLETVATLVEYDVEGLNVALIKKEQEA